MLALTSIFRVHSDMQLPWTLTKFHPRFIDHDCGQPSGHLRLSLELVQMFVGGQERVLNCIFSISSIPQHAQRYAFEGSEATIENAIQFLKFFLISGQRDTSRIVDLCYGRRHEWTPSTRP